MNHSIKRRWSLKPVLALATMLLVAAGAAGVSSQGVSADATNTRNVAQAMLESIGSAAGGGAVSGAAVTFNVAPVQQLNVQVIAGDQFTRDNSTQTAANTVNIDQAAVAATGDTTAPAGGIATSGPAVAGSIAMVSQLNVQVIAGIGCSVDQVASNTLDLSQGAGAGSGDASASVGGTASSGAAQATNMAQVGQHNIQVYVCRDGSTGQQVANNVGNFDQTTIAAAGAANAGSGIAASGAASASSTLWELQQNLQFTID